MNIHLLFIPTGFSPSDFVKWVKNGGVHCSRSKHNWMVAFFYLYIFDVIMDGLKTDSQLDGQGL